MSAIGNRELPIPEHIDIFHLQREMPPSDKTAIQCVMEVDEERIRLEHEAEVLATLESEGVLKYVPFGWSATAIQLFRYYCCYIII